MLLMKIIPFEDQYGDVLSKAQKGRDLTSEELGQLAGLEVSQIRAARRGEFDVESNRRLAAALKLDASALASLAYGCDVPAVALPAGLQLIHTPCPRPAYREMAVNAYVVHAPGRSDCWIFDSSTHVPSLLDCLAVHRLQPQAIYLTHSHWDHVDGLPDLRHAFPDCPVYIARGERLPHTQGIAAGHRDEMNGLFLHARSTPGHTHDGLTYVIEGLSVPVAMVGDAIFARSVGGAGEQLTMALVAIKREILSLPGHTVLCPGHGPLTTVDEELRHNPFFAENK